MAIVDTWDALIPPDSENPQLGSQRIRELKRALFERLDQLGANWPDGTDADSGKIMCGVQGVVGVLELVYEEDGDVLMTLNDDTAAAEASRVKLGTGRGGARDYAFETETLEAARLNLTEYIISSNVLKTDADSPYTVVDEMLLTCSTSGGDLTVNLPEAATNQGRILIIKKATLANDVTLTPFGGESIEGLFSIVLGSTSTEPGHPCIWLYATGSGWLILATHEESGVS